MKFREVARGRTCLLGWMQALPAPAAHLGKPSRDGEHSRTMTDSPLWRI